MYIDWAHACIPKLCAFCSYVINPLFIYILLKDTKLHLGNYKYLLIYFSVFNVSCSLTDLVVPVCIFDYRYAFSIFVVDGFFETPSELGRYVLAFRCSYITGTYAILHSHFTYRYMSLTRDSWLKERFLPYGLFYSFAYCAAHMSIWTFVGGYMSGGMKPERLLYLRKAMKQYYGFDTLEMNIIIAQYAETDSEFIVDSWIGIGSLSVLSVASLLLLLALGHLTAAELEKQATFMSATTKRQQMQLMKALVVQTVTPTVASFSPCVFSWYQPAFGIDGGRWLQHASGIAMSTFPFLDPLAIIFILPTFRRHLSDIIKATLSRRSGSKRLSVVHIFFATETH